MSGISICVSPVRFNARCPIEVMEDGSIRIYEGLDDIHHISKTLYERGVVPTVLARNETDLEEYYMRKVQGE